MGPCRCWTVAAMELESLAGLDLGDSQGLKGLGKETHYPSGTTSNNIQ